MGPSGRKPPPPPPEKADEEFLGPVSAPVVKKKSRESRHKLSGLDGRNRARVIAESLARVIAAIRITRVRWRSYLPLKTQSLVLVDPAFVVLRFESRDWRSLV